MKKYLYTFVLLHFAILSYSQFQIENTNWQQLIPNILGGSCVHISNVTFSGSLQSGAKYTYSGNSIGLTTGIVLSTGVASNQNIANSSSFFTSSSSSQPGDSLLQLLSGTSSSYDAAVFEFDFVSDVTDTLRLKYVFASEEYPEYVFGSVNDVFAFIVTGPGINGFQNMTTIPGTSLPVSINTLNNGMNNQGPCTNCTYYIANDTTQSGNLMNELSFDGLTTPLDATFTAQGGVTYHMKIAITDIGDSIFDSAVFLEMMTNYQDLNGSLTLNGSPLTSGVVEVYGYNTDSTLCPLIDSVPIDTSGSFTSDSLSSGSYLVRVIPDTTIYPGAYPMYFSASELWTGASILTLPCFAPSISVNPLQLNPGTGTGIISGFLFADTNFQKVVYDPMANTSVFLYDSTSGLLIAYRKSQNDGSYTFSALENGTYKIVPDVPGLYVKSVHYVRIDNNTIANVNYLVTSNGVNILPDDPITSIEETSNFSFNLYPNPATDRIIVSGLGNNSFTWISLTDLNGRLISTSKNKVSSEQLELSLEGISAGVYVMKIQTNTHCEFKKLIIK
jgi:hypothetical protein